MFENHQTVGKGIKDDKSGESQMYVNLTNSYVPPKYLGFVTDILSSTFLQLQNSVNISIIKAE